MSRHRDVVYNKTNR